MKNGKRREDGAGLCYAFFMFSYQDKTLRRIARKLRKRFANRIAAVYAFGSRVRGDHDAWSDFDVLVSVRDRDPRIEEEIVGIFVEEELRTGLQVTPLVKDTRALDLERDHNTPFYTNLAAEGVPL